MPKTRRKVEAVGRDFLKEIGRLRAFDARNQEAFAVHAAGSLTKKQLHLLVEALFFTGFRAYETFIRDVFLLFCLEKDNSSGVKVKSHLKPRSFEHAELLIQSSLRFLDWTSPANVVSRSELYLKDGYPIKDPYVRRLDALTDFKHIRNHIAHSSKESLENYKKVLRKYFGTTPLIIPHPGEYLLNADKADPRKYLLQSFFDVIESLANEIL